MKLIPLVFFLTFFLSAAVTVRAEDSNAALKDASQKLVLLESKVSQLTASQSQVIQKLGQIDQELGSLRIWIRRNRGGN